MKAFLLVKNGDPEKAFHLKELPDPAPRPWEVQVEVEAFGLNYADIMARKGLYRDCPPLPTVIGYEVVGKISELGEEVEGFSVGDRVVAFTRFKAYATKVVTPASGVVKVSEEMDAGVALAMAVQYSTAWFCAEEMIRLQPGAHVLVQAAAGGVGTALVQLAKRRKCIVYGTASAPDKIKHLLSLGVDYPINYKKEDFVTAVRKVRGEKGVDVVFDSLGGKAFKQGASLLSPGGRIIGLGASSQSKRGFLGTLRMLLGFGFYNPAFLLLRSRGIVGVNMLRIADEKPEWLRSTLASVAELVMNGELKPHVGGKFPASKLGDAHRLLESRKSIGKIYVYWD